MRDFNWVQKYVAPAALSTVSTLRSSYDRGAELAVGGDVVECGVFKGAQIAAIWHGANSTGRNAGRHYWLFDSFEGIPEAGPNDDQQPGVGQLVGGAGRLVSSGVSACSVAEVAKNLWRWGVVEKNTTLVQGWFQNTLPRVAPTIKKIALLRLDGDLYESTKVCLEWLYPKVVSGGTIVVDDYALTGARKAVHEYLGGVPEGLVRDENPEGIDTVYWRKP